MKIMRYLLAAIGLAAGCSEPSSFGRIENLDEGDPELVFCKSLEK